VQPLEDPSTLVEVGNNVGSSGSGYVLRIKRVIVIQSHVGLNKTNVLEM
jgi:hypothetical protein